MRPPTPIPKKRYEELVSYQKMKRSDLLEYKRFLCVWLRLDLGMEPKEIAHILGMHANTVRIIQRDFIYRGAEAFLANKCGGRHRQLITAEKEKDLLSAFEESGIDTSMPALNGIKEAFENHIGHKVHKSTIYRILHRNGWQNVAPCPGHPEQGKEAKESSKKRLRLKCSL
ncbi:MAG: helix-turn-helix domain-containing protein [Deferribacteraceae bacterium]|jgi:transposase|nr:helix-turn-helix domain-containing protein [Deferribacteraceae bacterium]